jgi:cbb3-type cytochrome oxidase subunit 3
VNPLLREAAGSVDLTWIMGVMTAVFLVFFLAWTWWAYAPHRKQFMEEAARLPFNDGGEE